MWIIAVYVLALLLGSAKAGLVGNSKDISRKCYYCMGEEQGVDNIGACSIANNLDIELCSLEDRFDKCIVVQAFSLSKNTTILKRECTSRRFCERRKACSDPDFLDCRYECCTGDLCNDFNFTAPVVIPQPTVVTTTRRYAALILSDSGVLTKTITDSKPSEKHAVTSTTKHSVVEVATKKPTPKSAEIKSEVEDHKAEPGDDEDCEDLDKDCSTYVDEPSHLPKFCKDNDKYTKIVCRKTCRFCISSSEVITMKPTSKPTEAPVEDCKDQREDCDSLKKLDYCNLMEDYMRIQCGKTCGLCSSVKATTKVLITEKVVTSQPVATTKPSTSVAITEPPTTEPTPQDTTTSTFSLSTTHHMQSDCIDQRNNCDYFKAMDYCRLHKMFMEKNCRETCGLCPEEKATTKETASNPTVGVTESTSEAIREANTMKVTTEEVAPLLTAISQTTNGNIPFGPRAENSGPTSKVESSNPPITSVPVQTTLKTTMKLETTPQLKPETLPVSTAPEPVSTTSEPVSSSLAPFSTSPEPASETPELVSTIPESAFTTPEPISTTPEPDSTTSEPISSTPKPISTAPEPIITPPQPISTTPEPISTTPEPIFTTQKPSPDCFDTRRRCAFFAKYPGYCHYHRQFMEKRCRKSCGFCGPPKHVMPSKPTVTSTAEKQTQPTTKVLTQAQTTTHFVTTEKITKPTTVPVVTIEEPTKPTTAPLVTTKASTQTKPHVTNEASTQLTTVRAVVTSKVTPKTILLTTTEEPRQPTTVPITEAPRTIPPKKDEEYDVVFVIGARSPNASKVFDQQKRIIQKILRQDALADLRYGLVLYSNNAKVNFPINGKVPWEILSQLLDLITWKKEGTRVDKGLKKALTQFGNRVDAKKRIVTFINGKTDATFDELIRIRGEIESELVKLIVVGQGTEFDSEDFDLIRPQILVEESGTSDELAANAIINEILKDENFQGGIPGERIEIVGPENPETAKYGEKLRWKIWPWGKCKNGKQTRVVRCYHLFEEKDYHVIINACMEHVAPMPVKERKC